MTESCSLCRLPNFGDRGHIDKTENLSYQVNGKIQQFPLSMKYSLHGPLEALNIFD